ncbi:hypothetical protein Pcinc_013768 [Petrolisthes cinctipes]|uniref:Ribosomal protein n=1 Tax=Petrolisthes cinctipes TaxID=88211 RepID=A0AAE1KTZ7_PETCI|nr:hypothetical protein Pcinc_013768 [Petrolisthes cinctipes]
MNVLSMVVRAAPFPLLRTLLPVTRSYHALKNIPTIASTSTLTPVPSPKLLEITSPLLTQSCGMKQKGRLTRRCKDCYFVMREGRLYVMCKSKPRHKQMAMKKAEHNTWILTHATQSPIRPW